MEKNAMPRNIIPVNIKKKQGTYRPGRENKQAPQPPLGIPEPRVEMDKYAREEWDFITAELKELGVIANIDRAALEIYCVTYSEWRQASEQVKKDGFIITTIKGNDIQNPLVGFCNRKIEIMRRFLSEFGLTPASRAKVKVEKETGKKKSAWAGM